MLMPVRIVPDSPPVILQGPTPPMSNAFGLAPGFVEVLITGLVVFAVWKFAFKN